MCLLATETEAAFRASYDSIQGPTAAPYLQEKNNQQPICGRSYLTRGAGISMKLMSPADFYEAVGNQIDRILGVLQVPASDQDFADVQSTLKDLLSGVQRELNERLDNLREQGEWDTFTIAFYGETNAGKSTLIETLRILLGEREKMVRRRAFKAIKEEHALSSVALEDCRAEVARSNEAIAEVAAQAAFKVEDLDRQRQQLLGELNRLQAVVVELKRNSPFWKKWLFRFRKPVEEVAQEEAQRKYQAFEAERPARVGEINRMNDEAVARMKRAMSLERRQNEALLQLSVLADGEIIGDGRSDFTRETASYLFDVGGQKFALLDVPGIEGNESKVKDQIWNAVQKAHAVFYITAKAAAPQKGDPGKPGTLEKIKAHLDDQTEVWTIFNKRVTNPMQLGKLSLVSGDEEASLGVLDAQMRAQLGENYQAHLSLSAQPAFWSVADCLVPGSSEEKSRAKFLERLSPDELRAKTGLASFQRLLTGDFVKDYRRKIRQANFNKAGKLVNGAVDRLSVIRHGKLEPLQIKLQSDAEAARDQVTIKLASLRSGLDSLVHREVDRFTGTVRRNIYARIDNNLDNDKFKLALAEEIAAGQATMAEALLAILGGAVDKFVKEIEGVVDRYLEFAAELLALHEKINIDGLKNPIALKIKIDNGIKLRGLLGAVATVAMMISNPAGWIVTSVIVLTLLVTFGKAIRGFFDDDYKKAQQRSAVNDNLQKVADIVRDSALNSVHETFEILTAKVQEVNEALTRPAEQLESLGKALGNSTAELARLCKEIAHTGTGP